jgi:pimeloyl-ACP methyl ester carboxylesterase
MKSFDLELDSAGAKPSVVLLHSSASSARQWEPLIAQLQSRFVATAVDLRGHGSRPAWTAARPLTLADDAALVEPLLAAQGRTVHLVGHSYGAAIALHLALKHPERIRSLVLYEPVVFALLFEYYARRAPARQVIAFATSVKALVESGRLAAAAQKFVDFWSGDGAWAALPETRRQAVSDRMPSVLPQFRALFSDPLARAGLARLDMPLLCLTGARTVQATRRIGELLRFALPQSQHEMLEGLGHLGPITHAAQVNHRIAGFLDAQELLHDARRDTPELVASQ